MRLTRVSVLGVHHDDEVELVGPARVDEKGDVVHHDRVGIGGRRGGEQLLGADADRRMRDRIERCALLGRPEDECAEGCPIEAPVGGDDLAAELLRDPGQGGRAGFHDLAGDPIGVDHHRSMFGQAGRHHRLAGRDPAGEADQLHPTSVPVVRC